MNFRDFEIARKLERRKQAHKAIMKKQMERPLSKTRAEKNILSPDPKITKNITFW